VFLRGIGGSWGDEWRPREALGFWAKWKALGCRCQRRGRNCGPKVVASMCHANHACGGYHPSVRERIDGKRLCRAWLERGEDGDL
jgi:hypothetical protein